MPAPPPLMSASYRTAAHAHVGLWEVVASGACTSWHPLNVNNFCSFWKLASWCARYNCHYELRARPRRGDGARKWPDPTVLTPLRCSHGCDRVTQTCPGGTVVALICRWMSQQHQAVTTTSNTSAFVLEHTHLRPRMFAKQNTRFFIRFLIKLLLASCPTNKWILKKNQPTSEAFVTRSQRPTLVFLDMLICPEKNAFVTNNGGNWSYCFQRTFLEHIRDTNTASVETESSGSLFVV